MLVESQPDYQNEVLPKKRFSFNQAETHKTFRKKPLVKPKVLMVLENWTAAIKFRLSSAFYEYETFHMQYLVDHYTQKCISTI